MPHAESTPYSSYYSAEEEEAAAAQERSRRRGLFAMACLLGFIWASVGIAGFAWSIVCMGRGGDAMSKIGGFLMAVFMGPLYWVYYYLNRKMGYCKFTPKTVSFGEGLKD
eukprot:tig00000681_g3149.t1